MVAMNLLSLSRLWTAAGLFGLAALWFGVLLAPGWAQELGAVFLASPYVLACLTVWAQPNRDRVTTLCAVALGLLFLLAWFL
jgi:hypothetical protein